VYSFAIKSGGERGYFDGNTQSVGITIDSKTGNIIVQMTDRPTEQGKPGKMSQAVYSPDGAFLYSQ
jgi:hypothetical protein